MLLSLAFYIAVLFIDIVYTIACYKCSSVNGSNPLCEDLFHGDIVGQPSLLYTPCLTQLRGRTGLFPATHCIKLVAFSGLNSSRYTYRTCGRDEDDDNGITRASHCGFVKLNWIDPNRRLRGCLHICDRDACNQGSYSIYSKSKRYFSFSLFSLILFHSCFL